MIIGHFKKLIYPFNALRHQIGGSVHSTHALLKDFSGPNLLSVMVSLFIGQLYRTGVETFNTSRGSGFGNGI